MPRPTSRTVLEQTVCVRPNGNPDEDAGQFEIAIARSSRPGETGIACHIQRICMTTTVRVSDETKDRLERLKREGESFDGLLDRLSRNETDIDAVAGSFDRPEDEGLAESVTRAHEELNRSLERRVDESEQ
jgi:predicted CopG family antitoxin